MLFFLLALLFIFPAFFAASELALLRLRPSRVERLIEEKNSGAASIKKLQRRLRKTLLIVQIGISSSLIAIGWLSNSISKNLAYNNSLNQKTILEIGFFLIIVILATMLGGLIPKALVLNQPEAAALKLSPLLELVLKTLAPTLYLLEKFTSFVLKIIGLNNQWDSLVSALTAGELETLIETGKVTGLRPNEKSILESLFSLRDTQVREVMVPRSGMVTLPRNVKFSELMHEVHVTRHARFLVTGESLDDVLGVLDIRHLAKPISEGSMNPDTELERFIKAVPKVNETCTLEKVLPLMRCGNPFLLVVDEHGGTEGLITAADLTGEIVGDEMEFGRKEPILRQTDDNPNTWLASGEIEIIEVNRQLKLNLPEAENHHTLAGFLLEKLQKIPKEGQKLVQEGIWWEITSMHGPRINLVKISLRQKPTKEHS